MGPARIYPWRKMHRSRAPSIAPGTFFVAQPWADCITNMPGFNLRQAQVQALKPGETIWDADHREAVRGFGVRRQGDQATYVLKYRGADRQGCVTIGPHGAPWTPELARKEAKRLLGLVANGKDPADEKAKARLQAA